VPHTNRQLTVIMALLGCTFLIYEVSWHRLLTVALGATVTASTVVLAVFMAGLGAGAMVWGRLARGRANLTRLLAALSVGIAVCGFLTYPWLTSWLPGLYAPLGGGAVASVAVFVAAALGLLVPTMLMGGLFPVISQLAARGGGSVAGVLGRLYAADTLGSALGGLLTGYVLLGALGQRATLAVAVIMNVGLAIWLVLLRMRASEVPDEVIEVAAPRPRRKDADQPADDPADTRRAAFLGAALGGFAMLALQILWMRAFRIYFTNTSYTFALVSSLVILGVFVGSSVYARRGAGLADPRQVLVRTLVLLAGLATAGLWLLVRLPQTLMLPFQEQLADPALRVLVMPFVASLLIVVPPAICSGFALPLACRLAATRRDGLAGDVGRVLLANTAGATVGPVLAAFVMLPLLGVASSTMVTVAVVLAGAAFMVSRPSRGVWRPALLAPAGLLVLLALALPGARILPPSFIAFDREILDYRESVEGTLSVAKDRGQGGAQYTFVNNSAVIGSSYDAVKVVKMVGHYPFLMGLEAREVLVVGFGIGVTTSAIASHASVESIECVELVPGLRDAAVRYREFNHDVARDPRLHLIAGDGRHYLQRTDRTYDLISCDPTHPILGSGSLYTADYFRLCREHLNPGGMVSQYLPLHKLGDDEFLGLVRTFAEVFPHCTVWLGHFHAVLLGGTEPMQVDFTSWSERVEALGFDRHFYVNPHHLAATLVFDGDAVSALGEHSALNTDDRSYTEFFAPSCLDASNLWENLRFLNENRVDVDRVFTAIGDEAGLLGRYVAGNRVMTEGLYHKLSGDLPRSLAKLQEAVRINPEDEEFPFLVRLYFERR